ncbi:hypothetical protein [Cohnella sp. GCM10012308]|uniref:hypothetical protein n=1 Tax=Cohnella sp. GCM10012308 TaxID=3317329 RepID=UPI00361BF48D
MFKRRLRLPYYFLLVTAITMTLLIAGCSAPISLADSIMKGIDLRCGELSSCSISMRDITDFKWDKVVVFQVGSSNPEVSHALGFEYHGSTDLMSGIIFVSDNKIVAEQQIAYYPEKPSKLQVNLEQDPNDPNCASFSSENANFKAGKVVIDGKTYYELNPSTKR